MKQTVTGYYKIIKRTEISDKEYEKKKTGLPIQAIEKDWWVTQTFVINFCDGLYTSYRFLKEGPH